MSGKKAIAGLIIGLALAVNRTGLAADHYVRPPGTTSGQSPYTNWDMAATSIQWAVNAAVAGENVWVSNGTYYLTNQITIAAAITAAGVNGREVTIVDGNWPNVTNRCFNISASAVLDGFTIRNGYAKNADGGGVYSDTGGQTKNCRIIANTASNNYGGGGVYLKNGGMISNCEIFGNSAPLVSGGGVYAIGATSLVVNCVIASNTCAVLGGGALLSEAFISQCKIYRNYGPYGGGIHLGNGTVRDSLIYSNRSNYGGGIRLSSLGGIIQNCTVVSNIANTSGGGMRLDTGYLKTALVENVVCYFNNSDLVVAGDGDATGLFYIVNSCINAASLTNSSGTNSSGLRYTYFYTNNIQSNPQFVDKDVYNFHLAQGSPGINSGLNESWMNLDLDGHSRIDRFSGVVDMGAYEYLPQGTIFSVP